VFCICNRYGSSHIIKLQEAKREESNFVKRKQVLTQFPLFPSLHLQVPALKLCVY
jgi:hypothetical protein